MADQNSWYSSFWNRIPGFRAADDDVVIDYNSHYSQLTAKQLEYLQSEAKQAITKGITTWCWYEDVTNVSIDQVDWSQRKGILSVYGTGSSRYPLECESYPEQDANVSQKIYIKNSTILPSGSPVDWLHEMPFRTRLANSVKHYYNYPNEAHLYLRNGKNPALNDSKILIISITGHLPEKYEKFSIESQRSARYISTKLAQTLKSQNAATVCSLSLESPLDTQDIKTCLDECVTLLKHFEYLFDEVDAIFFTGIYHSTPLVVALATHILKRSHLLGISENTIIGIMAMESVFQGYRFWDHSADNALATSNANKSNNEANNEPVKSDQEDEVESISNETKFQQAKEKQLFQGSSKKQQETLQKLRNYRKLNSTESVQLQTDLDWILFNWKKARLTLFGKLYDNYMTLPQKLAIDYKHPKIMRNVWCNGKFLEVETKKPEVIGLNDIHLKSFKFESDIKISDSRMFELTLINLLITVINLGYVEFTPLLKLLSPLFISRSFNENTVPPTLKRQILADNKIWMAEMEEKWKAVETKPNEKFDFPSSITSVHSFLQYAHYENQKSPQLIKIYNEMYDDDDIYNCFLENTTLTKSPLHNKHLALLFDHSTPKSILQPMNQYDLVWKLHESLSHLISLNTIPVQTLPLKLAFSLSLDYSFQKQAIYNPLNFKRNNKESLQRVIDLWSTYKHWDPPTRGLKQLKEILSVFSIYNDTNKLISDLRT